MQFACFMQICYIFKYFAIESRQTPQKENKMFKAMQNFLILTATIALFFSACATQQQSAMQMELEEKQALAELVCNERNNAEACFVVGGWLLEDGFNAKNDTERIEFLGKAQKYLLKSCDLNHGDGCFFYAMLSAISGLDTLDFKSIKPSRELIGNDEFAMLLKYIKKSCELDSANGCETLGKLYYLGDGVKKDEKLGFFYRKKN